MVTEVNAVEFRENVSQLLDQVQFRRDSVVIRKDGEPVAALVDATAYARLERMLSQFDEIRQKIAADFANIPEEEGMAEIDRIVYEERHR